VGDGQLVDRATARVEVLADACVYSVTVSNTVAGWTGLKRPTTSRAAVGTMPAASGTDGFRFLPHPPEHGRHEVAQHAYLVRNAWVRLLDDLLEPVAELHGGRGRGFRGTRVRCVASNEGGWDKKE
jgi:hypothetical protein